MQTTSEEYLDNLLASMNNSSDDSAQAETQKTEDSKSENAYDLTQNGREIISDDDVFLSESDLSELQAMIDDVEDYSLEAPKDEKTEEEQQTREASDEVSEDTEDADDTEDLAEYLTPVQDFSNDDETGKIPESDIILPEEKDSLQDAGKRDASDDEDIDDSMSEIMQMLNANDEEGKTDTDDVSVEELLRQAELADGGQEIQELAEKENNSKEDDLLQKQDLGELLGMLSEEDSDLAEIDSILKKSDSNVPIETEMLSLLEEKENSSEEQGMFDNSIVPDDDLNPENTKEEKKRTKKEKKKRKKKDTVNTEETKEEVDEFDDDDEDFLTALFKKKPKADKKKGKDKDKPAGNDENAKLADVNAALEAEMEKEDKVDSKKLEKDRKKKEKKAAKDAKKKSALAKREEKYAYLDKGRKISKKATFGVFVICFSVMVVIITAAVFYSSHLNLRKARESFYQQNYEDAISRLYGKKLNDSDQLLFNKSVLGYAITFKIDAYYNYKHVSKEEQALDALLQAVKRAKESEKEAVACGMEEEVHELSNEIYAELLSSYQLVRTDVDTIVSYPGLEYTVAVHAIISGDDYLEAVEQETNIGTEFTDAQDIATEETTPALQDILPEEEELLER